MIQAPFFSVTTKLKEKAFALEAQAPQTIYSLLYIGNNEQHLAKLSDHLHPCFAAENYAHAKRVINSDAFKRNPADVVFVDVPLNDAALMSFRAYVMGVKQCRNLLVMYNKESIAGEATVLKYYDFLDDVIDFEKFPFSLSGKIDFLKKARAFNRNATAEAQCRKARPVFSWKRALDIVFSALLIALLLPVFLLIAIAVKLESKGPVFYNARRAGRGFKVFKFYKFRTMEMNADKKVEALKHMNQYASGGANFFKLSNDPRITRVGKILRNTSLDELPQLLNVLKGDMSLVGNRPLPLYEAETLTTNEFAERFVAPAGITGLWQINKRGKASMSTEERIGLDIYYARRYSLMEDIKIIARTPAALLQKTNA